MDRAPLRGMVLNALIPLYGYCQGWCRVRGGKAHTALAPQTTPHKLVRTNVRDNSRKDGKHSEKNPGYLERKPGPEFCDFGHSPEASFWPPSTPHALGLARSICTTIIHISRSLSSISSTGALGRQLPPRCLWGGSIPEKTLF
jgi:hypothetical protein